ncbi:hypothetical protein [Qaidamihabitans albus]|uniref:hypothetical protein n=1 Tax=Qaidamihabitans albus TaxID=2795733 RepID=UPI0018F182FE|nr:hypothetical protein [Qaidamihabitans albus]
MGSSEIIGGAIGLVVLLAVVAVGVHGTLVRKPKEQASEQRRVESMSALVRRFGAVVHTPQSGTRPSFGVLPDPRLNQVRLLSDSIDQPYEQAVEFPYRGHEVLALDYSYNRRTRVGGDRVKLVWLHNYLVQVRTPPTPWLRISARRPAGLTYPGRRPMPTGYPPFDEAFEVVTSDERFARASLTGPVLDLLVTDARYRDKFVEFQSGTVRSEFSGRLSAEPVLANADMLIDLVRRLPPQTWHHPPQ